MRLRDPKSGSPDEFGVVDEFVDDLISAADSMGCCRSSIHVLTRVRFLDCFGESMNAVRE